MRLAIIASLSAAISAEVLYETCGPSAGNFLVARINQAGSPVTGAAACGTFNMDLLDVTIANSMEVSALLYSCLGTFRHALVRSWNGVTYNVECLEAFVTTATSGLAIAAIPTCPPPQAVVCQQRGNEPIILPGGGTVTTVITATSTATQTQTASETVTSTIPPSTTFLESTTTTVTSTATVSDNIACSPILGSQYVFISDPTVLYTGAEAKCREYGMDLAYIDNMDTFEIGECVLPGQKWFTQPVMATRSTGVGGLFTFPMGIMIPSKVDILTFPTANWPETVATQFVLCQSNAGNSPPHANLYYMPNLVAPQTPQDRCTNYSPKSILGYYTVQPGPYRMFMGPPSGGPYPLFVQGFPAPVEGVCSTLRYGSQTIYQQLEQLSCDVTGVSGVVCQLPQLVTPQGP